MEDTRSSSDSLIDDTWILIFSYFSSKERACFARVSKKWRDMIHKPSTWSVFELSFLNPDMQPTLRRNTTPDEIVKIARGVGKFIGNYCTSLVDLWIELPWLDSAMVDTFFQIKTLRRFALHSVYSAMSSGLLYKQREAYKPKQPPACKDLRLLALEAPLMSFSESLETVLSTLPNLEEYYMNDMRLVTPTTFSKSKKLQIIGTRMLDLEPTDLIEWCPSLKYVIFNWEATTKTINHARGFVKPLGNFLLISDDTFDLLPVITLDQVKQLGHLWSPHTYEREGLTKLCYLLHQKKLDIEVFKYLVNELKFDINEKASKIRYDYRPVYQSEKAYVVQPGMLLWERPLDVALTKSSSLVKFVLGLGAKAEFPFENNSFLLKASRSEDRMLLLKNGADPNKLIDGVPVFMKLFTKHFDDAPEVVYELVKRKCDLNFSHNGETVLSTAVAGKRWDCVEALLKNGANWTAGALRSLLLQDLERAKKLLKLRDAELEMLDIQTAAIVVHRSLGSHFSGSFDDLKDKREENNLTLLHLVALSAEKSVTALVPERKKDPSRWVIIDDDKAPDTRKGFTDEGVEIDRKSMSLKFTKRDPKTCLKEAVPKTSSTGFSFGSTAATMPSESKPTTSTPASSSGFSFAEASTPNSGGFSFNLAPSTEAKVSESSSGSEAPKTSAATTSNSGGFSFANLDAPLVGDLKFSTTPVTPEDLKTQRVRTKPLAQTPLVIEHDEEYLSSVEELKSVFRQIAGDINAQTNSGETALLLVCKAKMKPQVLQNRAIALIEAGADVNIADKNGWTPLHAACYRGSWAVVEALLKHKANINAQDKLGITPPMAALYGFKHCAAIKTSSDFENNFLNLIQAEAQTLDVTLTEKESKRTLLHLLACVGGVNIVTPVIGRDADLNSRDADGFTPLHYAVMFDNFTVTKILIEFGADVNAQTNALKLTPIMMFFHMLKKDRPYNAYLQHYNTMFFTPEPSEVQTITNLVIKIPPLYEAPWNAMAKFSLEMLAHSFTTEVRQPFLTVDLFFIPSYVTVTVKSELRDVHGNTLLHTLPMVAFCKRSSMTFKDELWSAKNDDGDTPFHLICRFISDRLRSKNLVEDIEFFTETLPSRIKFDKITNANEPDSTGVPPLHHILQSNLPDNVKQIFFSKLGVKHTFPVQIVHKTSFLKSVMKSDTGVTVEHFANLLNNAGSDPAKVLEEKDESGSTLFLNVIRKIVTTANEVQLSRSGGGSNATVVQASWMRIFDYLLNSGMVDLGVADKGGNTAIHIAGQFYHTGVLDSIYGRIGNFAGASVYCLVAYKLIAAGADTMAENNNGETVYDYVPNLMEHYKSIYKKLIKDELKYTDSKP